MGFKDLLLALTTYPESYISLGDRGLCALVMGAYGHSLRPRGACQCLGRKIQRCMPIKLPMIAACDAAEPAFLVGKLRPHQVDVLNRRFGHSNAIGHDRRRFEGRTEDWLKP